MYRLINLIFALGPHKGQKRKIELVPLKEFFKRLIFVFVMDMIAVLPFVIWNKDLPSSKPANIEIVIFINEILRIVIYSFFYKLNKNSAKLAYLISAIMSIITGAAIYFMA